jgi:hypothetical protein
VLVLTDQLLDVRVVVVIELAALHRLPPRRTVHQLVEVGQAAIRGQEGRLQPLALSWLDNAVDLFLRALGCFG